MSLDCSKVNNNFDYLYLSSCIDPTSLTVSNLFINNIENILRVKLSSKNPWDEWVFLVIIPSSLLYWVILLTQKSLIDYCDFSSSCANSSNRRSKTYCQPPPCYAAKSPEHHQFLGITFCGCLRECLIKLNVYYLMI